MSERSYRQRRRLCALATKLARSDNPRRLVLYAGRRGEDSQESCRADYGLAQGSLWQKI